MREMMGVGSYCIAPSFDECWVWIFRRSRNCVGAWVIYSTTATYRKPTIALPFMALGTSLVLGREKPLNEEAAN